MASRLLSAAFFCAAGFLFGPWGSAQTPAPANHDDEPNARARFAALFAPHRTELATLSPDGKHLAYSVRENEQLSVLIVPIDRPETARAKVLVADDRSSTPHFSDSLERVPARINWMKWASSERLVVETNRQVSTGAGTSLPGVITSFSVDGTDARVLLTPREVQELVGGQAEARDNSIRDRRPLGPTVDDPHFSKGGTAEVERQAQEARDLAARGLFDAGEALAELPADGSLIGQPDFQLSPLTPQVFDLDPETPGAVLVRTVGARSMTMYRLDAASGKLTQLGNHPFDSDRIYLLDRQGRPRISAPSTTRARFPHILNLDRGPGSGRSRSLGLAAGLGSDQAFAVSPENFFGERAMPLGFDERPEILYYASNVERDTYGIYSVDLASGRRTDVALEHPTLDLIARPDGAFGPAGTLVYDRFSRRVAGVRLLDRARTTRWIDVELQGAQALLEKSFPGRSVEILEWDASRRRLLAAVGGPGDAGGFVVFDRPSAKLTEFARRAPWLDAMPRNRILTMNIEVQPGLELACRLTFSTTAKVKPQPLVVICPPAPWERMPVDFQPEVQALAEMGFAVLQFNSRGAWGHGVRQRESIREGYDRAQVGDLLHIVDEVGKGFAIDPKRVGIVGAGHGGHVALRAMASAPDRFRCGIALEPPVDLAKWLATDAWTTQSASTQLMRSFYGSPSVLAGESLMHDAPRITRPTLIYSYAGERGGWRRDMYMSAKSFAHAVRRPGVEVEFRDLPEDAFKGLPRARAEVYQQIEYFLNTHVYDFSVKLGEQIEVKDR